MGNGYDIRSQKGWAVTLSSIFLVALFTVTTSFAGDQEKIAWNSILPEESNLSLQQQRVINSLDITLAELESVIDNNINEHKVFGDADFNTNGDIAVVYDFLMYRIYELIKLDRNIKEEFKTQEKSFGYESVSSEAVRRHHTIQDNYEKEGGRFFSSLDGLKRAIVVKDLRAELKKVRTSITDLRSAMNIYSSYRIATVLP